MTFLVGRLAVRDWFPAKGYRPQSADPQRFFGPLRCHGRGPRSTPLQADRAPCTVANGMQFAPLGTFRSEMPCSISASGPVGLASSSGNPSRTSARTGCKAFPGLARPHWDHGPLQLWGHVRGGIIPAQPIANNEDYPAQNATAINTGPTMGL